MNTVLVGHVGLLGNLFEQLLEEMSATKAFSAQNFKNVLALFL